jgi:DNA ligase (NAD+)
LSATVQRISNLARLPSNIKPPANCPSCKTALTIQDAWPFCPNFLCPMRVYGRLQKFVDVLDIKGAGVETLKGLAMKGLAKTPGQLYKVTEAQFTTLERKGEAHFKKFRDGLERARTMRVPQFFACLDFEGEGTWENIIEVPGLSTVEGILSSLKNNYLLLAKAVRVSDEKALNLKNEIEERYWEVECLQEEIKMKVVGTTMAGKVICITGTLSRPRPQLEEMIINAGGKVAGSVTSKVTHLVTDDPNATSGKAKEARAKKIPMINEKALMEMLGK